jgi:micrococcal nuclease
MFTRRTARAPVSVIVILLVTGLVIGDSEDQDNPKPRAKPKVERTRPRPPKKAPKMAPKETNQEPQPAAEVPAEAMRAEVISVTDGDTVKLTRTGSSRLIGIDTPEVFFGEECFGREASDYAKAELHPGDPVWFVRGAERRDRYGRSLVYLWTDDGSFFNAKLARLGFAVPLTIEPNSRFADLFGRLAAKADRLSRGLWAKDTCAGDADRPAG